MPNQNLVSIVLPVYNASGFLSECLESLLNQTYKDIEIIAIDDLSRDDSYAILKQYKKIDSRLRVYRNKKRYGLSVCFNRAVKKARGAYIAFMDPHDKSNLHRIKRQLNFLNDNPKVTAVGTQCTYIAESGKPVEKSSYPQDIESIKQGLLTGISVRFETLMINRSRIPKDLLRFSSNAYPFIYTDILHKLVQYGNVANMGQYLHYHRQAARRAYAQLDMLEKWASTTKMWMKTFSKEETRPPLRDLFPSISLPLKFSK